jgi:thioredoxin reductase (NADPH)
METLVAFLIAAGVTLFFVRGYLKKLTAPKSAPRAAASTLAQHSGVMYPCPRCEKKIGEGTAFCPHCGAALAMWNVHRAKTQTAGEAPTGKPKPVINATLCVGCGTCISACPEDGPLELVNGKAILSHPERCTGHAKCAEVCPTQALSLAYGGVLQRIRVPIVKDNFETNVPGMFIVGELAGLGLIKTAINEGKLVMDYLRDRLAKEPDDSANTPEPHYDVAIIGAGPAGLSASLTAHQYEMKYVTLEQGEIAATIRQYPRQKFLMAEPLAIPLYGNLYVGDGTKEALLAVWETIITNTGVRVRTNERLERVERSGNGFYLHTPVGKYHARYVVLALGRRGAPKKLNVKGEDLAKVAYRLIEADSYEDKDIIITGGGDSAIEAALALSRSGKNRVALVHRGTDFRRARDRNQQFLNEAQAAGKLRVLLETTISEIQPESVIINSKGQSFEVPNDYLFILIGGESPEDFLRKTGIEIVEKALTADLPSFEDSVINTR